MKKPRPSVRVCIKGITPKPAGVYNSLKQMERKHRGDNTRKKKAGLQGRGEDRGKSIWGKEKETSSGGASTVESSVLLVNWEGSKGLLLR